MQQGDQFWKFTMEPYGECPLQAEGTLLSGEKFYFRLEGGQAELCIGDMKSKHALDNPLWRSWVDVEKAKPKKGEFFWDGPYSNEDIEAAIKKLLLEYAISVEGEEFDDNEVVDLPTWRRRELIKQQREKQ